MPHHAERDALEPLTPREQEVLELLRLGLTDAEITGRLDVSTSAIRRHVSQIIAKLRVRNRYEAAAWPERPPWWATALAPMALFWRRAGAALPVRPATLAAALTGGLFGAALVGLGFMAFLLLRDGGGGQSGLVFAPTATRDAAMATALPPLVPPGGVLVYLRGNDLWVASLDSGQGLPPRAITNGSLGTRYAGYVRRNDGGVDLYRVSQLTKVAETNTTGVAEFGVYRVPLEGGDGEEVLRFSSGVPEDPLWPPNASVSPDGEHIMYVDTEGLVLFHRSSEEGSRLLDNLGCQDEFCETYYTYYNPQWAPGGDLALVMKFVYEGSVAVLVQPFDSPVSVTETSNGAWFTDWSPDGKRVCLRKERYLREGPAVVYDVATGETRDTSVNLPLPTPLPRGTRVEHQGCAWSEDGRLAIGYRKPITSLPYWIAVLDAETDLLALSDPIQYRINVIGWLPDGSGVIFNRFDQQGDALGPAIFQPESGIAELSFEADWVLGVIP